MPSKGVRFESDATGDVTAARGGRVSYVDAAMPGYGATVLLEHADGYTTVYAADGAVLVEPGRAVRRGETLARAKRLYFEVRKDGRPSDPAAFFPASA